MDGAEDTKDVGLELTAVVVQLQPRHRANDTEAGVGHGHVEAAERRARRRDRPLEIAIDGHITGNRERAATVSFDLGSERNEAIGPARGEHEVGAFSGEGAGQRRADSRRSARDEDDLAAEPQGICRTIASSA